MSFGARALIRLRALNHNLEILRRAAPGSKVMAVIKANAYGHGMRAVAKWLEDVDGLAVARLPEALELRKSGIDKAITLLSGVLSANDLQVAADNRIDIVVHCDEQLDWLNAKVNTPLTVWLKIDTGMHRLGFAPERAPELMHRLTGASAVAELRLMTHFADADNTSGQLTMQQFKRIADVVDGFDGSVSFANSAATLGWPDIVAAQTSLGFYGDHWIRPGIALFGISPFADRTGSDFGLKPVMHFEAHLIAKKPLRAGGHVGYAGRYVSDRDTQIGIIAAGYGDGYSRHFTDGTPVLINNRRVPLIGNVSMDLIAVDLGPDATDKVGDIATLWGDDLPVEEVARWADTIPYELVCGVTHREALEISV